jgi:uncharacterized Zn finger protein
MNGSCKKCGYKGEMHQVGRILERLKVIVIQCPNCCLIYDLYLSEPMEKTEFVLPKLEKI